MLEPFRRLTVAFVLAACQGLVEEGLDGCHRLGLHTEPS